MSSVEFPLRSREIPEIVFQTRASLECLHSRGTVWSHKFQLFPVFLLFLKINCKSIARAAHGEISAALLLHRSLKIETVFG
jgi:hypothetical protein